MGQTANQVQVAVFIGEQYSISGAYPGAFAYRAFSIKALGARLAPFSSCSAFSNRSRPAFITAFIRTSGVVREPSGLRKEFYPSPDKKKVRQK